MDWTNYDLLKDTRTLPVELLALKCWKMLWAKIILREYDGGMKIEGHLERNGR